MRILIIDNFDSFTYNLYHYVSMFEHDVSVVRYDNLKVEICKHFDKLIISPGPGLPKDYPKFNEVFSSCADTKSILGVCLGMQAIVTHYGGKLCNLKEVLHGKTTIGNILVKGVPIFKNIPEKFTAGHYHSWVADSELLPDCIEKIAVNEKELVMAIRHKEFNITGVQFHPESVMTEYGIDMIRNWLYY